jgi:hypothetical protein
MRFVTKLAIAAIALSAYSTAASAAISLGTPVGLSTNPGPAAGESIVWNFNTAADALAGHPVIEDMVHFSFVGNTYATSNPTVAAAPAGDTTGFGAAQPGQDATFSVKPGTVLTSLSFDLGSLDDYNTLTFTHNGVAIAGGTFSGALLANPNPPQGQQSGDENNLREYFTFTAADGVNGVVFSSTDPAFEFDNIAASIAGVPEPATWAMMILGFGFVGFMMRSNRQKTAIAVI